MRHFNPHIKITTKILIYFIGCQFAINAGSIMSDLIIYLLQITHKWLYARSLSIAGSDNLLFKCEHKRNGNRKGGEFKTTSLLTHLRTFLVSSKI